MTTSRKSFSAGSTHGREQPTSSGESTAGSEARSTSTPTTSSHGDDEVIVSHEAVQAVMHLYVKQGAEPHEMKRRAAILKLEAATIEAAFKILDKLGLDPNGSELDEIVGRSP